MDLFAYPTEKQKQFHVLVYCYLCIGFSLFCMTANYYGLTFNKRASYI